MQLTILPSSFLFLVCTSALPNAFVHENSTEHLEGESVLAPMAYVGSVTDGGEIHQLNGTVEKRNVTLGNGPGLIERHDWNGTEIEELQLNATLTKRHDWNGTEIEKQNVAPRSVPSGAPPSALEKRVRQLPPHCNVGEYISTVRVQRAIDAIKWLPGSCPVGWGTEKCTRISCHHNTGITLCNDNLHDIAPLCRDLGDYAQTIVNECQIGTVVRGQVFDSTGFNVIVQREKCLV